MSIDRHERRPATRHFSTLAAGAQAARSAWGEVRSALGARARSAVTILAFALTLCGLSAVAAAAGAPIVGATSAQDVTATTVTLTGSVNPGGDETTYQFEYGTDEEYGSSVPATPASVGSGSDAKSVTRFISGLEPETTYHFRLTATNASGTTNGPDRTFSTLSTTSQPETCPNAALRNGGKSANLPDCRAYELVSPVDKNGADIAGMTGRTQIADDGSAAAFAAQGAFGDARGTGVIVQYMSERDGGSWLTHAVMPTIQSGDYPTTSNGHSLEYVGDFSADLSTGILKAPSPLPGTPSSVAGLTNLYKRGDLDSPGAGAYGLLTDCSFDCDIPAVGRAVNNFPHLVDASEDRSTALFSTVIPLTADAPVAMNVEKTYLSTNGTTTYVGQIPPDGSTTCGAGGPECIPAPRATAQGGWPELGGGAVSADFGHLQMHGFLSEDGSRAFFVVAEGTRVKDQNLGNIFLRDTQGTESASDDTTTQINVSERSVPTAPQSASLWYATDDGSRAFFASSEPLTDDAPADGTSNPKLYLWTREADDEGHHLTLISRDDEPADSWSGLRGVMGIGDAGKDVYFATKSGRLTAGEPTDQSERPRMYRWREGQGLTYIGYFGQGSGGPGNSPYDQNSPPLTARVSPDGSKLLLVLSNPPRSDSFDHGTCFERDGSARPCQQIYLYDSASGKPITCISCPPSGRPADGDAWTYADTPLGPASPGSHLGRAMTADGRYVFFTTTQALLPEDVNGPCDAIHLSKGADCADVYRYDTESGELGLLSEGKESTGSYFLDASPDGSDVLISTRERLVGTDADDSVDLYDVRVDGGLAAQNPEEPEPPCTDVESCHGVGASAPDAEQIGSIASKTSGDQRAGRNRTCDASRRKLRRAKGMLRRTRASVRQVRARSASQRAKHARAERQRARKAVRRARRAVRACRRGDA